MRRRTEDRSMYERLKVGLEEGILFARGELTLRTTEIPETPPAKSGADIVRLRKRLNMSQGVFARVLNVSAKTVQSWEHGERKPSQAALRLLQILEIDPQMVSEIIGIRNETRTRNTRRREPAAK